jgi:hypothetical protein
MTTSKLSRRPLVATAAALQALAVPAVAIAATAEPDPVFAAIEAYRNAEAAFIARSEYEDAVGLCNASEQTSEMKATVKSDIAARVELANTAPTTLAGLVAYLDYVVVESEKLSSEDCPMFLFAGEEETLDFVRSLRRSATALAAQS